MRDGDDLREIIIVLVELVLFFGIGIIIDLGTDFVFVPRRRKGRETKKRAGKFWRIAGEQGPLTFGNTQSF